MPWLSSASVKAKLLLLFFIFFAGILGVSVTG